jgi:peroxiredoxin
MPGIQAAYEKYKDKGLVVLGIDFTVQDHVEDVKAFIQEFKLTFPILLDETGDVSAMLYGMRGLPTSYFIDPEGVIQRIQVGTMLPEKIDEYLAEILLK